MSLTYYLIFIFISPVFGLQPTPQSSLSTAGVKRNSSMSNEEVQNPPNEYFPQIHPDAPELLAAGAHELKFVVRIACKDDCPFAFLWSHMKSGQEWEILKNTEMLENFNGVTSVVTIRSLESNTKYYIRVKPSKLDNDGNPSVNWYDDGQHAPYTPPSSGVTCDEEQEGVRHLLVHSAGPHWLALSWEPPISECTTHLEYHVRHYADQISVDTWWKVGAFWTNATWSLEGNVKPCSLWPDRHCLLIMNDIIPNRNYTIEVKVVRTADGKESNVQRSVKYSTNFPPSSPLDLHCVEVRRTSLKLRWRCPLQPGGRLTLVHIRVQETVENGIHNVTDVYKEVEMRPEYQHTVYGLTPSTFYKVTAWFESYGGLKGAPTTLEAWTTPNNTIARRLQIQSCKGHVASDKTAEDGTASNTSDETCECFPWWTWILITLGVIISLVIAFFAGNRRRRCLDNTPKIEENVYLSRTFERSKTGAGLPKTHDSSEGGKRIVDTMVPLMTEHSSQNQEENNERKQRYSHTTVYQKPAIPKRNKQAADNMGTTWKSQGPSSTNAEIYKTRHRNPEDGTKYVVSFKHESEVPPKKPPIPGIRTEFKRPKF